MIAPVIPIGEAQRLRALHGSGQLYTPSEARFDRITRLACSTFNVPMATLSLVAEHCQWFKSSQGISTIETPRAISFCGHGILQDGPLIVEDALLDARFVDNPLVLSGPGVRFYAGQPVRHRGQAVGMLCVMDTRPRAFSDDDRQHLASLVAWVENEIDLQLLSEAQRDLIDKLAEAERRALLDPLTRCWNRAAVQSLLPAELARAARDLRPLALLMIDLDGFKSVNDRHGHLGGDLLLAEVAQRIRASVRPSDLLLRYGGDEFLLLLADVDPRLAQDIAQRVLLQLAMTPFEVAGVDIDMGASIGVAATRNPSACTTETLIAAADAAMYEAKSAGRGCVRVRAADAPSQPEAAAAIRARR